MVASERRSCNPLGLGMMVLLLSVEIPMGIVLHFTQVLSPETDTTGSKKKFPDRILFLLKFKPTAGINCQIRS